MREMMAHAELYEKLKIGLWTKYVATVTKLENIMVNLHEEKCAYNKFYGQMIDYKKHSKTLGWMVFVHSIVNIKYKLYGQGITCMLLGYSQSNTGGTHRTLNLRARHIILSRNFIWLNKTYGKYAPRKYHYKSNIHISCKMKTIPINELT